MKISKHIIAEAKHILCESKSLPHQISSAPHFYVAKAADRSILGFAALEYEGKTYKIGVKSS